MVHAPSISTGIRLLPNRVLEVFRLADIANKEVGLIDTNLLALFSQPPWRLRNLFRR